MINRKQITNLEKLTRVMNEISGRVENKFALAKKELANAKELITALQQDKVVLNNKLNTLTTRVTTLETQITATEIK